MTKPHLEAPIVVTYEPDDLLVETAFTGELDDYSGEDAVG